jgi:flagellar L-ring protein FlgH
VKRSLVFVLLGSALVGCGPAHIGAYVEREREYSAGPYERAARPVSEGSLWMDESRGLFADFRATSVGDILTIRIDENPRASGDASTDMERDSSMNMGVNGFFGLTSALTAQYPGLDPSQLLNVMSESNFNGNGQTSRSSRVRAQIAVRVKQELPNGDLFVEGTKILMVNDEELHVYISGVIRPEDIEQDNSIRSSLVADAQIEFTGRGYLTRNQEPGWLTRILQAINPF